MYLSEKQEGQAETELTILISWVAQAFNSEMTPIKENWVGRGTEGP